MPSDHLAETTLSLRTIICHATGWYQVGDHFRVRHTTKDADGALLDITRAELAAVHPWLPPFLDHFFNEPGVKTKDGEKFINYGFMLGLQLACWANALSLTTVLGAVIPTLKLHNLQPGTTPDTMRVTALTVQSDDERLLVEQPDGQYQAIPVVLGTTVHTCTVPYAELERHFPGWQERYAIATALGLEDETLVQQVCTQPPTSTVAATLGDLDLLPPAAT